MEEKIYSERIVCHSGLSFVLAREGVLFSSSSPFQKIEIIQSKPFGCVLLLDGTLQLSEFDEYIYHEMAVHPGLLSLPRAEKVLIIGGGDGGILRRVLMHPVSEVILVEIDRLVVEASKKYLKKIHEGALNHPKAKIIIQDGMEFIRNANEKTFDVIICDSTDPFEKEARVLFEEGFYKEVQRTLHTHGIFIQGVGNPYSSQTELVNAVCSLQKGFSHVFFYGFCVPTYVTGWTTAIFATKNPKAINPSKKTLLRRLSERKLLCRYYNPEIHFASRILPEDIKNLVLK